MTSLIFVLILEEFTLANIPYLNTVYMYTIPVRKIDMDTIKSKNKKIGLGTTFGAAKVKYG